MHSVNVISIDATQKLRVCLVRLTPGTETLVCSQIDTSLVSPPFTPEGQDGGEGEWSRGRKKKLAKKSGDGKTFRHSGSNNFRSQCTLPHVEDASSL